MALKKFLMIGVVATLLVACDDDIGSNSVTDSEVVSSSSVCKNCDDLSSSKVKSSSSSSVTPKSSDSETSVSSSSSVKSSSSSSAKSSSSSAKSSSSSRKKGDAGTESGMTSSSAKSSSSSVASSSSVLGTMTDERDGQTYKTVKIGTQTWMAENLNYAYTGVPYKVGGHISDSTSWCYDNDPANCAKYGRLYTWAAAMDSVGTWSTNGKGCGYGKKCSSSYPVRGICPEGWHLPDMYEWDLLIKALGDTAAGEYPFEVAGKKLKSTSGWYDNGNGLDTYSFTALPAGFRDDTRANNYYGENRGADFWTSTEGGYYDAFHMSLSFFDKTLDRIQNFKNFGFSVRCVKD